jgi:hypothetical protein
VPEPLDLATVDCAYLRINDRAFEAAGAGGESGYRARAGKFEFDSGTTASVFSAKPKLLRSLVPQGLDAAAFRKKAFAAIARATKIDHYVI